MKSTGATAQGSGKKKPSKAIGCMTLFILALMGGCAVVAVSGDDEPADSPAASPAPTTPPTASQAPQDPAEPSPDATVGNGVPVFDLLDTFYATEQGEPWVGTVTTLERIGPAGEGGIPVYRVVVVGGADGVAACQAVEAAVTDGAQQINVNDALGNSLATTNGPDETCEAL